MTSTSAECKFASFWLMFEIFATSLFTILVAGYMILGRHFYKKSLKGSTVLITNGYSNLTQELARKLIDDHQCKVILIFEPNIVDQFSKDKGARNIKKTTVYQCNTLDHNQVKLLSDEISQNIGTIDIIIENGKTPTSAWKSTLFSRTTDRFIEETSNKIIITLNLLIHFIPKLRHSTRRGQFVTIQSETHDARPFLETSSEVKELIRNLSTNGEHKPTSQNELCLSTVVYNDNKSDNKLLKMLELNLCEIADAIIRGIQSEKHVVVVSERRSLIDYVLKLIKFKFS